MSGLDDETVIDPGGEDDNGKGLAPGTQFGNYRIVRQLGRGGMGTAYAVEHQTIRKAFALKILHPEVVAHGHGKERFEREAQVMAGLEHPAILPVDDFGETDGRTWLRMPLIEGIDSGGKRCITLSEVMAQGPVDPETARGYLTRILEGLAYAHGKGVVHRDLKPDNLLMTEGGPLIADFGLVKLADADWLQSQVELSVARSMTLDAQKTQLEGDTAASAPGSSTRALMGTFAYMSPEQKRGADLDARSDLYTLGQIAYQLLTGRSSLGLERPSEIVDGLSPAWDLWITRLLKENPAERFQSAEEALEALPGTGRRKARRRVKPVPAPKGPLQPLPKGLWIGLGLAALVLIGLAGAFFGWMRPGQQAAAEARLTEAIELKDALSLDAAARMAEALEADPFVGEAAQRLSAEVAQLQAARAGVVLTTEPPEARLTVGAVALNRESPLTLRDLPLGIYPVEVRAPGFEPFDTEIRLDADRFFRPPALELTRSTGQLAVTSEPVGLPFTLTKPDGEIAPRSETTPADLSGLPTGEYRLTLSRAGWRDQVESVLIERNGRNEVAAVFGEGSLEIGSEPEGLAFTAEHANGIWRERGTTPASLDVVPAGRVFVTLERKGWPDAERTVEVGEAAVTASAVFPSGSLTIDSNPDGLPFVARHRNGIWTATGTTSLTLDPVPAGEIAVTLRREGWPDQERVATVTPDGPAEVAAVFPSGRLAVKSEPTGAVVSLVDGRTLGTAPLEMELPPGDYQVRVDYGGVIQVRKTTLETGKTQKLNLSLSGSDFLLEDPGIDLVWIEPGEFLMGSPSDESGRDSDEGPQTRVRISRGYWLGATEVTQGQWASVMGNNPSRFGNAGRNAPVESVLWNDAMAFCRKLTERERAAGRLPEGYAYSLPTEAEWEYAARAGTTTRFSFGNSDGDLGAYGWYSGNAEGRTHGVGQKRANAWGLYDMHGNVWEWTSNWYGDYPGGSVTDYAGPASGSVRVLRGGRWDHPAQGCRSANRSRGSPGFTWYGLGFRLALRPVP